MESDSQDDTVDTRGSFWPAARPTIIEKQEQKGGCSIGSSSGKRGVETNTSIPSVIVKGSVDNDYYYMDYPRRGKCLIFNHKAFQPHTNLNCRRGTDEDASALYRCFRELDFDVTVKNDLKKSQILSVLDEVSKEDHTDNDCFVCCMLSHGEEGIVFGCDGKLSTEKLFAPFHGDVCKTLAGKPKIFFIQACQGDRVDRGVEVMVLERADSSPVAKIPVWADFLIAFSTVPGYYSWRNTSKGSWFIQALCMVLQKHAQCTDLLHIMTLVNRMVAYEFESCVPGDQSMHMMKQVPCVTSTLTRKIHFPPKL